MSFRVVFLMINSFPVEMNFNFGIEGFRLFHTTDGVGTPATWHISFAICPSLTLILSDESTSKILGGSTTVSLDC